MPAYSVLYGSVGKAEFSGQLDTMFCGEHFVESLTLLHDRVSKIMSDGQGDSWRLAELGK